MAASQPDETVDETKNFYAKGIQKEELISDPALKNSFKDESRITVKLERALWDTAKTEN